VAVGIKVKGISDAHRPLDLLQPRLPSRIKSNNKSAREIGRFFVGRGFTPAENRQQRSGGTKAPPYGNGKPIGLLRGGSIYCK